MITDLSSYSDHKCGGPEWLGEVPTHWDVVPGRACLKEKYKSNKGMVESDVLSISFGRIVVKPPEKLHGLVPESFETYQVIKPGDIIVRPIDLQNDWKTLRTAMSPYKGIITSAYICLHTHGNLSADFCDRMLRAYDLMKVFYGLGSGLRQNLSWNDFKYLPCLIPPPEERAAIVRFLAEADRLINRLIRNKRRLIDLLIEQKQVIITKAVTRGLDPTVPMKATDLSWLGAIPAHWSINRATSVFSLRKTTGRPELPILTVSLRTGVRLAEQIDTAGRPMRLIQDRSKYQVALEGDLCYNMMRLWQGAIGVVPTDGLVSPAYVVITPRSLQSSQDYYELLFKTHEYTGFFNRVSRGIVSDRNRTYWDDFKTAPVICPPLEDQKAIVAYVKNSVVEIENAIGIATNEIRLLSEYRTRLIADVVTGKLDVRSAAAALPDPIHTEPEPADVLNDDLDAVEAGLEEEMLS